MSYFSFGEIFFDSPEHDVISVSFELVQLALSSNLYVLLGCNIPQKVVFEMLDKERQLFNDSMPFLLTATPLSDVSDELISPYALVEDDDSCQSSSLFSGINKIRSFLEGVIKVAEVEAVDIYFSEGYAEEFNVQSGKPDEVYQYLSGECEKNGDMPQVKFTLKGLHNPNKKQKGQS
ncbi:hypothetical protein [Microbulbifer sp. VAAF005]|uniref:hypothetical protein n=1 Tax=Microbulbifer sp. VAAF005 TaxID=3034230 RepID=UPI0024AD1B97|nr:hypothetical protein [Microbulbifer sp. VAAF005]WHI46256.1 hypothetical protein P0078_21465 [Microbulbifer sp. VAAF005]